MNIGWGIECVRLNYHIIHANMTDTRMAIYSLYVRGPYVWKAAIMSIKNHSPISIVLWRKQLFRIFFLFSANNGMDPLG